MNENNSYYLQDSWKKGHHVKREVSTGLCQRYKGTVTPSRWSKGTSVGTKVRTTVHCGTGNGYQSVGTSRLSKRPTREWAAIWKVELHGQSLYNANITEQPFRFPPQTIKIKWKSSKQKWSKQYKIRHSVTFTNGSTIAYSIYVTVTLTQVKIKPNVSSTNVLASSYIS